ncbi:MAG: hypothetical protein PQJ46_02950 [Spirochaetales bacterium]|nr:hypothetical protein [Spirochaetales bacterium]
MTTSVIGSLNEKSLHKKIKNIYLTKTPNAVDETKVDDYIIDIVSPNELIEIQTGNFSGIKTKISKLVSKHPVKIVHPVAAETIISTYKINGELKSKRRSPKRGCIESCAGELLYIADLLYSENLSIEILLIRQEEKRIDDGKGARRRRGISIKDRTLLEIIEKQTFKKRADFISLLPENLPSQFSNSDIADKLKEKYLPKKQRIKLASQISYLLRKLELIKITGKDGNRLLFSLLTNSAII